MNFLRETRVPATRRHSLIALGYAGAKLQPLAMVVLLAIGCIPLAFSYAYRPDFLFGDTRIYFRATEAWLAGENPWLATNGGIYFAAPPPALFLSLPLIPFGEDAAVVILAAVNSIAIAFILLRLRLPLYFVLFYPLVEALYGGSTDLVLAALVLAGAGVFAAFTKPYSIPAMLADGRWIAIAVAGLVAVATIPVLPWSLFIANFQAIRAIGAEQSHPNSALGIPWLMVVTVIALLSLGPRRALALLVPALIAEQPHYAVFSLLAISRSTLITLGAGWPSQGAAAVGVIGYAIIERLRQLLRP